MLKCIIDLAENVPKYLRHQLEPVVTLCMKVRCHCGSYETLECSMILVFLNFLFFCPVLFFLVSGVLGRGFCHEHQNAANIRTLANFAMNTEMSQILPQIFCTKLKTQSNRTQRTSNYLTFKNATNFITRCCECDVLFPLLS